MTALCAGGGTSSIQPGFQQTLVLGSGGVDLIGLIPGLEWLQAIAVVLGVVTYELTTLCATDPPAMPTFTDAEAHSLSTATLDADYATGIVKFKDALANIIWYRYCKCDSGAQPVMATPPAAPANVPTIQQASTVCFSYDTGPIIISYSAGAWTAIRVNTRPTSQSYTADSFPLVGTSADINTLPTSVTVLTTPTNGTGSHGTRWWRFVWNKGAAIEHDEPTEVYLVGDVTPRTTVYYPPSNVISPFSGQGVFGIDVQGFNNAGQTDKLEFQITVQCGPLDSGGSSTCCVDPVVYAKLDALITLVTALQRQATPTGYVLGTAHSGLSGDGLISVTGLVGVKVELTTIPARVGTVFGETNQLFQVGWLNLCTTDGCGPRLFIANTPFLLLDLNPAVTGIAYSIPADVVATITELAPVLALPTA